MKKALALVLVLTFVLGMGTMAQGAKNKYTVAICGINLDDGLNATTEREAEGFNTLAATILKEKFPDIEIEFISVPWDGASAKIQSLLLSNDCDLFTQGGAFIPQYYKEGLIQSLTPFVAADAAWVYEDNFPANLKTHPHCMDYSGTDLLTLPWQIGYRSIIYDTVLFDQWGVEYLSEYPTPEEILEKAEKMTGINPVTGEENYGVWIAANSLNMSYLIPASEYYGDIGCDGNYDDPRNLDWSLNSEGFVKAVQWACDLSKFAPAAAATGQGFEKFGKEDNDIAIQIDRNGGVIMGVYYRTGDDAMIERFVPTMHIGTNGGNWTPCDGMGMNANLKGADAEMGWEILKFMCGPEVSAWFFNNWGPYAVPHLIGTAELFDAKDIYLAKNALIVAKSTHPGYEINPFYGATMQPTFASMISRAMAGEEVDVQKELDDLQKTAVAWSSTK
ncbi:MAG: extracellular solute-binding protein [Clostridia bacterium]|nr:extracellular solute-binding protein [Clostridia bacterium]